MPKKIQKKISKLLKVKSSKFNFKFIYFLLLFLPLLIWYGYKQLVQQPDVYQVVESGSTIQKPISSMTYNPTTGLITVKLNPTASANGVADRVVLYWSDKIPPLAVEKDKWVDWAYVANNTKTLNVKVPTPQKGTESVNSNMKREYIVDNTAKVVPSTNQVTFQRKLSEFTLPGSFGVKYYRLTSDFLTLSKGASAGETWEVIDQAGLNPQTDFTYAPTPVASSINSPIPTPRPPTPSILPTPTTSASTLPTNCRSNLSSIAFKNPCGTSGFTSVSYQCSGSEMKTLPDDGCVDPNTIYAKVSNLCGTTCSNSIIAK